MRKTLQRSWGNSLCLIGGLLLTVACLETALRMHDSFVEQRDRMYATDDLLGWRFMASKTGPVEILGGDKVIIQTNRDGFRDTPFETIPAVNFKIAVLGDSFVSNINIPLNDVFTKVMERRLHVNVMNFGVNGFSPTQEYYLLDEVIKKHRPNLVVLVVYIENDFSDNLDDGAWWGPRGRPYVVLGPQKEVILMPSKSPPRETFSVVHFLKPWKLAGFIRQKIKTIQYVWNRRGTLEPPENPEFYFSEPELLLKNPPEEFRIQYAVMEDVLKKINLRCQNENIPVLFVIAPSKVQVDGTGLNFLRGTPDEMSRYDLLLPNRRLEEMAQRNHLLMLNLTPRLQAETARGHVVYHPQELHWNQDGNQVVADEIVNFIKTRPELQKLFA